MTKNVFFIFLILLIQFISHFGFSQTYPKKEIDLDAFILNLFAFQEDDINYDDLYESLFQLYRNPLNLNKANREELQALYILSEFQINSLLKHLNQYGKFLSIYELQSVEGIDLNTIYKLIPFVTIRDSGIAQDTRPLFKRIVSEENQFFLFRYDRTLEKQRGYRSEESSGYLGDQSKLYLRYRSSHSGDFSVGFTMEKDPGEQINWSPGANQYGADFNSFHATFYNKGKFKAISVGDYQIQIGQSLLLSAGFQVGKGSETTATVRRSTTGIKPFSSVLENGFFRGVAATYELNKNIDITGFTSFQKVDFSIREQTDSVEDDLAVLSTFFTTGFHRTQNELDKKDNVNENILGGHISFKSNNKNFNLGITALNTKYDTPVNRGPNNYNQFQFNGDNNFNLGLNFSYIWQNFNFFGELASSKSGGKAFIGGFVTSLSKIVEMSMLFRSFGKEFHSFYGLAFAETSGNINEQGLYWGIKINPNKRWSLAAYYDAFKFPWLKLSSDAPSTGNEYLIRLTHRPSKRLSMFAQYRYENKGKNLSNNNTKIDIVVPSIKRNYVLNLNYKASNIVSLKSRVQFSNYEQNNLVTKGFAIAQDLNFDLGKIKISTRYALFETDDFNNSQFMFEKNVLYAFAIPAYSGIGVRKYLLIRWKTSRKIDLWARYARTTFTDRDVIGSGLQQIFGNKKSDLTIQLRIKI